jgi:hypothetical protein
MVNLRTLTCLMMPLNKHKYVDVARWPTRSKVVLIPAMSRWMASCKLVAIFGEFMLDHGDPGHLNITDDVFEHEPRHWRFTVSCKGDNRPPRGLQQYRRNRQVEKSCNLLARSCWIMVDLGT